MLTSTRARTWAILLTAALATLAHGRACGAQIRWDWSWGTEGGYFVTNGSLVNRAAPAGTYNVADFVVSRSANPVRLGSISNMDYNEGSQPGTGFRWDGSKDTQWFRDGGRFTNGANYYGTTVNVRYLFAVGLYLVGGPSTLSQSSTIALIPRPYASLQASGTPTPGGAITFDLESNDDVGKPYQLASSLGTGPIPIGTRQLNLTPDGFLVASISGNLPSIFSNYGGVLNNLGRAQATLNIPNVPGLTGLRIHTAFVTVDPGAPQGINAISETVSFGIL